MWPPRYRGWALGSRPPVQPATAVIPLLISPSPPRHPRGEFPSTSGGGSCWGAPEWTPTLPLSTSLNDEQRVGLRAINNMIRRASHTIPSKCVHTRCSVSGPFLPRLLGRRLSHLLTLQPNTPHQLASLNGRKALPSLLNKCNVASYQLMSTELCQANPPGTIDHISMVSNGLHAAHTGHVT